MAADAIAEGPGNPEVVERMVAHAATGSGAFTFDPKVFSGETRRLPIGVFDSGVGGLTVLESLLTVDALHNDTLQPGPDGRPDLERERFLYFGDKANMPYGNYAAEGRGDYLRELILKDAVFLLGNRWREAPGGPVRTDKPPVKAIVIACNTGTAAGLEDIRAALAVWKVPVMVVGVVEAGAVGVLRARREREGDGAVAVMATVGTCATGAYPRWIQQTLGRAGRAPAVIVQQGSPALAGVIEGDPAFQSTIAATARADVRALLEAHRQTPGPRPVDTIVLGCTHFPLALGEIDAAFDHWRAWRNDAGERPFADLVAAERAYVDPAAWTARELFRELASARLRVGEGETCVIPEDLFFVSAPNPDEPGVKLSADGAGLDPAYKYGRDPGRLDREDTVNVPMRVSELADNLRGLLRDRLPAVWTRLGE
jgi:glutamate racemase